MTPGSFQTSKLKVREIVFDGRGIESSPIRACALEQTPQVCSFGHLSRVHALRPRATPNTRGHGPSKSIKRHGPPRASPDRQYQSRRTLSNNGRFSRVTENKKREPM